MIDELRVLVVDDAADLRFLISLVLEEEPSWVIVGEAGDGADAVDQAGRLDPHLVLVDAAMPVMDGLETLPRLRAVLPDALLVMLTAFPRGTLESAADEAGADACLDKMNLVEELVPSLRRLVDLRRLPGQTHARAARDLSASRSTPA
ncbi:response regulator transcription factor [Nocardioides marmoribigeumensis]|uniref:CheY-like chemotaxis protein n=1 Tax=Nocardioides marmoribigeumensis TaxID=433649 RepID=A0ABU2BPE7_9ACTN|nr:response regulator [Nocardioides marmoribigeumensis]MDR7360519.1 CheY-like chemotaxis protein [Nocardioides marmoribigeumensis]